jgi:D-inositol-3-phosphate glycosyltransferase
VVAAAVGGLPVAVADARTLVHGHDPARWAETLSAVLDADADELSRAALAHAQRFSWDNTVDALLASYGRAMADYGSTRRRGVARDAASRRSGRRWTKLRGVRA